MLDWFLGPPRCPVDVQTKEWIENGFNWLEQELGLDQLTDGPTLTPTVDNLPIGFECTFLQTQSLMKRIAVFMDIDPDLLILDVIRGPNSIGQCIPHGDQFRICLEPRTLDHPLSVLIALSQLIAQAILLSEERVSFDEPDLDNLAALLCVYLGIGLFPANGVLLEDNYCSWPARKHGDFTMEMFGYALAIYALARNEPSPDWFQFLRLDVRNAMKLGVRYIQKTGDCDFAPARAALEDDYTEMQEAGE